MTESRRILLTSALPYANGEIHLGHLVEYIINDVWARFQKMRGHECLYICADDTHGTPVMIRAQKEGISPDELVAKMHKKHAQDFADFQIEFDNYYTTNSEENKKFCEEFYLKMQDNGHIERRLIQQLYCPQDKMFLPDRFVKGTCPKCKSKDQYGDSCDSCGATYQTNEVLDAACSLCGSKPIMRESDHYFFKLSQFKDFLQGWVKKHLSEEVQNKLAEWLTGDLRDWDISRDAPYFGFKIPGTEDKYFYVWLDAPIGYMASTQNWCDKNNRKLEEFWKDPKAELYHFIGKDILYFHTLFWPAMLDSAGYKKPNSVFVHGFLTVNGEKMSKSKGTFLNARDYLKFLDPGYLRYYYACKMTPQFDDIDLSFDDFSNRVNSELIGKITNLASRLAPMLNKKLGNKLGEVCADGKLLLTKAKEQESVIADHFENRRFSRALVCIRDIADDANKYVDSKEPWKLIKTDEEAARKVITTGLNLFRVISIYLTPVLPEYSKQVQKLFNEEVFTWGSVKKTIENFEINTFEHLAKRVEKENIEQMIASNLANTAKEEPKKMFDPLEPEISIEDFMKIDLRVGKVLEANAVEGADKLIQLKVDIGVGVRNIFAGIKSAYEPAQLVGKLVGVVANLRPRKMKFGLSEGMVIAAGPGGKDIKILSPDEGAKPGDRIK